MLKLTFDILFIPFLKHFIMFQLYIVSFDIHVDNLSKFIKGKGGKLYISLLMGKAHTALCSVSWMFFSFHFRFLETVRNSKLKHSVNICSIHGFFEYLMLLEACNA